MRFFYLFLSFMCFEPLFAQNTTACISGVVNQYTPVLAFICDDLGVEVESTFGFSDGDLVLIIQMQGAQCITENTSEFGNIVTYNQSGNYEINRIRRVSGNRVELQFQRTKNYDLATGKVQLVKIPEYQDVAICDLTCLPWNGDVGGICAIKVNGTLTLQGPIDVSAKGFRGGIKVDDSPVSNHETDFVAAPNARRFAQKGEGIVILPESQSCGRGKAINGGGGGNAHNAGGGGGSNGGNGGRGGREFAHTTPVENTYGVGGIRILDYPDRLFMGGGGGAGQSNDGKGTNGGIGGGIALILAEQIVPNGYRIYANGEGVLGGNVHNDGQGGGGAGGTIAIEAESITGLLRVDARGGRGGNSIFQSQKIGPGGGGGGGRIIRYGGTPVVVENVEGGLNGLTTGSDSFGSEGGDAGVIDAGLFVPLDTTPIEINVTTTVTQPNCDGGPSGSIEVSLAGALSYQLGGVTNTNGLFDSLEVGSYTIQVEYAPDCFVSVDQVLEQGSITYLYERIAFCAGSSVVWQGITYTDSAEVSVTLPTNALCDSVLIGQIIELPLPITSQNIVICPGDSVEVAGQWYSTTTTVIDTLFGRELDCDTVRTTYITLDNNQLYGFLSADTSICAGDIITLRSLITDTKWPQNATGATYQVQSPGLYIATALTPNGCLASDSVRVSSCCEEAGIYVPNAFAPDVDGPDNLFRASASANSCGSYILRVYDRWGTLMFESDKPYIGWDGTYQGQAMPPGVYVWDIEFTGRDRGLRRKGDVSLVR
jgi:gliding motility-associated-like protein